MAKWKYHKNGLLVTDDETQVIGVFHVDQKMDKRRKTKIRACIANSEKAHELLQKFIDQMRSEGGPKNDVFRDAAGLLAESGFPG